MLKFISIKQGKEPAEGIQIFQMCKLIPENFPFDRLVITQSDVVFLEYFVQLIAITVGKATSLLDKPDQLLA
jgi:hypothetical protein